MPARYSKEQHLEMNQVAWDEGHRYLAAKMRKDPGWVDEYSNGSTTFTDAELDLLEDVSGLDVLQLSCAGDANQAFSLANLGAKVMACDFSPVAIEEAKENALQVGLDVHFVVDDSQRLSNFKEGQFDLVHVDGNLWQYEDLSTACYNWHRVLRAGGRLLLHENYPLTHWCLEEDKTSGNLHATRSYGDRTPEYSPFRISDFVSEEFEEVEFPHTMADILNAIMQAGFVMERMVELDAAVQGGFGTEEMAESVHMVKLPHEFFVTARKVA